MGLFDKKYCDVCGDKIGLLGNRKLENGNLCKNCAKKLSPWFDERRHSTVEQIKSQLAYREENRKNAEKFSISRSFGKGSTKLFVDEGARKFTVNRGTDIASDNADILDFSQAAGCDLEIKENRHELRRTVDGNSVSYNPPRYEYNYDFKVRVRVNHPYFDEMEFDLSSGSVHTGENRMSDSGAGAWRISRAVGFLNRGENEYNELVSMGNELKAMIDGWRNGGTSQGSGFAAAVGANQPSGAEETLKFGGTLPYPLNDGSGEVLEIRYIGTAKVSACDTDIAGSVGGFEAVQTAMTADINAATVEALRRLAESGTPLARLMPKLKSISEFVTESVSGKWKTQYGYDVVNLSVSSISMTEESHQRYKEISKAKSEQQFAVQPQSSGWVCHACGASNDKGNFCTSCGTKRG